MKQCNSYQLHFYLNCWLHLAQSSTAKHHAIFQLKGPDVLEASVDTGSYEKCFICIVIITRTSALGCIYILMFYSSLFSNAPLNYTEHRQRQTPIAPNLLLHYVKQQPSNLALLIITYHTHPCFHIMKYITCSRYWTRIKISNFMIRHSHFTSLDGSGISTMHIRFFYIGKIIYNVKTINVYYIFVFKWNIYSYIHIIT